jgi:hypothetical protein
MPKGSVIPPAARIVRLPFPFSIEVSRESLSIRSFKGCRALAPRLRQSSHEAHSSIRTRRQPAVVARAPRPSGDLDSGSESVDDVERRPAEARLGKTPVRDSARGGFGREAGVVGLVMGPSGRWPGRCSPGPASSPGGGNDLGGCCIHPRAHSEWRGRSPLSCCDLSFALAWHRGRW